MPSKLETQRMAASTPAAVRKTAQHNAELEGGSVPQQDGTHPPPHTAQTERDEREKRRHPASENALESSQDKNPIPLDSTRQ